MTNTTDQTPSAQAPFSPSRLALLRLHHEQAIKARQARALFDAFDCPTHIFLASARQLSAWLAPSAAQQLARPASPRVQALIERSLRWAAKPNQSLLTWLDNDYPALVRALPDAPVVFYAQGRLETLHKPAITLVGAREATDQGLAIAQALAEQVARAGWCVVSGLARGIDAAAHLGALKASSLGCCGTTLAVQGTGPDQMYPPTHRPLANRIVAQGGLLLTEFAPGTLPAAQNFPRRNQWVAALGRATVVIEARARSGSLITARLANEYGREVFAVPGHPQDPLSQGTNHLIKQGAHLLESVNDIWHAFGLKESLR
jgi:DNA processing protein